MIRIGLFALCLLGACGKYGPEATDPATPRADTRPRVEVFRGGSDNVDRSTVTQDASRSEAEQAPSQAAIATTGAGTQPSPVSRERAPDSRPDAAGGEAPSVHVDPRRRCRVERDCVLLPPRPCTCPPCGDVLREALNVRSAQELQQRWAKRRCTPPEMCTMCVGRYVGSSAACVDGQCVARI